MCCGKEIGKGCGESGECAFPNCGCGGLPTIEDLKAGMEARLKKIDTTKKWREFGRVLLVMELAAVGVLLAHKLSDKRNL